MKKAAPRGGWKGGGCGDSDSEGRPERNCRPCISGTRAA